MELVARLEKIDAELAGLTDGVECRPVAISVHHAGRTFKCGMLLVVVEM